jgi:hemerythrin-like domain-containing protein
MVTTSQDLIREHKTILIALNVIEKMYERVQNNNEVDIKDIECLFRIN